MRIFEKKWFRLIIFIVLLICTFVAGAVVLFSDAMAGTNELGGAILFGVCAVAGQLFLFIAFDTLYGVDNKLLRLLRMLFIILGALICFAAGVGSSIFYSVSKEVISPWLRGFCGMWFAYGVISFYLYYFADYNFWPDAILPFLQLIAFAGAYFITVIFAYVGEATVQFCYGYPVLIACAIAFIVMCIILKKKGLPFDIDLSLPDNKRGSKKPVSYGSADDTEEYTEKRKSAAAMLISPLEGAAKEGVYRAFGGIGVKRGNYGNLEDGGSKLHYLALTGSVKIYGEVYYRITSTLSTLNSNDIQDDAQNLVDELAEDIIYYTYDKVQELKAKYEDYDNFTKSNIKTDIRVVIKK